MQSHPSLSLEERSRLCRCLNYEKLTLEACKELAKNPRIPPRVAVEALAAQSRRYYSTNYDIITTDIPLPAATAAITNAKDDIHGHGNYSFVKIYKSNVVISPSKSHNQMVLYDGAQSEVINDVKQNEDDDRESFDGSDEKVMNDDQVRLNLQTMQWRVLELEKVCRKMKGQMSRMGKASSGRTPLLSYSPSHSKAFPRLC